MTTALPKYPEGLPRPQRAGYGFTPVSGMRRTNKLKGRARSRPTSRSTPTEGVFVYKLSAVQCQLWISWWHDVLIAGTAWHEQLLDTEQGQRVPYKCRFTDDYDGPVLEGVNRWIITVPVELYERPVLRNNWALYAPQFMLYMKEIDIAVNQTWPEAPDE